MEATMALPLGVLIVEDSEDDAQLLVRQLSRAGYEPAYERVESVAGLATALDHRSWDLVISDNSLPQFSGRAALNLVRERDADVPFIIVSGTMGEQAATEAMRVGAQDYFVKGHLSRLIPAIQRELRDAEVRRERHRAEGALGRSEATYRSLVEDAPYGIFRTTHDGRLLAVNPAMARMLGYDCESELLGRNMASGVYVDPEERNRLVERISKLGGHLTAEALWRRKDGRCITVRQTSRAAWDLSNRVEYFDTIVEDITERRTLEMQLRQAQKMDALGRVTATVAHDFNNLLAAILGGADLLLEALRADAPEREEAQVIHDAAIRAADLTRQLLAFSRQQVLAPKVLDVNRVVAGIESVLQRLIGGAVDLHTVLAPDLGAARADPGQLEQVIVNLAVNARDAMPDGGKLTIETANTELDDQYARQHGVPSAAGPCVMLAVTDTGSGMDAETQARIFEPFFTTKEAGKGTGLGLATVYGIVKQSGGLVWVYSEPGHGTTFKVYLPRVQDAVESVPGPGEGSSLRGTETILVVEDQAEARLLTRKLLEARGYTVVAAASGTDALVVAAQHQGPIDLLVTDAIMPGMSGWEVSVLLSAERPQTTVLYLSGYTHESAVRRGLLDADAAFLQKPFSAEWLARKVRQVLDASEATRPEIQTRKDRELRRAAAS
jgi:PAS domain S-box-containing protein